MNATPNIPQQNSAPEATSASSFQIAEIKTASREFERLFQNATFRDAVSEKSSEENDELIGQALDWRQQTNSQISVDFAEKSQTESNTRRAEQPVARFDSAQQGTERAEAESKVEKGKTYFWCACGLSQKQPFCDGRHKKERKFESVKYIAQESEELYFCGCKMSGRPPFCDGSHSWTEF